MDSLELEDNDCEMLAATEARFSLLAACQQHDVVIIRYGAGLGVAGVHLHCFINGECVSLLQIFTMRCRMPGTALAVWHVNDCPHESWEMCFIKASKSFCVHPDNTVGALPPIEFAGPEKHTKAFD